MRIIGLLLITAAVALGSEAHPTADGVLFFLDFQSAVFVLGGTLALLLFSGSSIGTMFKVLFSNDVTPEEVQAGSRAWTLTGVYSLTVGAIGTIVGLVIMLNNMDDPAAIGPGMAIALLTQLYGFWLAFAVARPMCRLLEGRAA